MLIFIFFFFLLFDLNPDLKNGYTGSAAFISTASGIGGSSPNFSLVSYAFEIHAMNPALLANVWIKNTRQNGLSWFTFTFKLMALEKV